MKKYVILCFTLLLVFSLTGCYYHLSPEAAMEGIGIGHSNQERIEADGCYFYYQTVADNYENAGEIGDWLYTVTPVRKGDIGMWYASPDPRSYIVKAEENDKSVGSIASVKLNGKYHNFFIPFFENNDPVTLPDELPNNYETITFNSNELTLFKHSYFVTDEAVKEFEIGGLKFIVSG